MAWWPGGRVLPAALLSGLLLASSVATAEPGEGLGTPTTLYLHLGGDGAVPINTQAPDEDFHHSGTQGGPVAEACLGRSEGHTYWGFPLLYRVAYLENGSIGHGDLAGIAHDVHLDIQAPATAHWYLETQAAPGDAPMVLPNVVVEAALVSGGLNDGTAPEAVERPQVIAEGRTQPAHLSPLTVASHPDVGHHEVDGRDVYAFAVPLEYQMARIDQTEAYHLRLDVSFDGPCQEGTMAPQALAHSSPDHRPRLELAVRDPVRIEHLRPMLLGPDLVLHTALQSPWGRYDLADLWQDSADAQRIRARVEGPSPAPGLHLTPPIRGVLSFDDPMEFAVVWPYQEEGALDGRYTVHLEILSEQDVVVAAVEVPVRIGGPPCGLQEGPDCIFSVPSAQVQESPAVVGPALLALLGGLAAVLRRP